MESGTTTFVDPDDVAKPYLRMKEEVEENHGLRIGGDAMFYAHILIGGKFGECQIDSLMLEKMQHILNEACELTRSRILSNEDEKELDSVEYIMRRSLVEYNKLVKEKYPIFKPWFARVSRELSGAETKLLSFMDSWKPISAMPNVTPELVGELQAACGLLHRVMEAKNLTEIPKLLGEFLELLHKFDGAIRMKFRDIMAVGQHQVKEVASRLSGIPIPLLPPFLARNAGTIPLLLREMVLGHDHMTSAMMKTMFFRPLDTDKPRVPKAFLFLGASGVGKVELAKAIALHLYDNVDRLIRMDLSESALGRLVDTVSSMPYSVILFRKIEKAPSSILDIIIHMLKQGRLIDGQGRSIDFTNTMVIMTSNVGAEQLHLFCKCFLHDPRKFFEKHDCYLKGSGPERVIEEAKRFLKPELLKLLDNIYVFEKRLSNKLIASVKLRDMVRSITERKVVVYASEEAFNLLSLKLPNGDGHVLNQWLSENVRPMLSKMVMDGKIDDTTAVYIDTLVGMRKLSFRLESSENLVEDWLSRKYKVSLRELRAIYRTEREVLNLILNLKDVCSKLMHGFTDGRPDFDLESVAVNAGIATEFLVALERSLNSVLEDPSVKAPQRIVICHRHKKAVKKRVQNLRCGLQDRLKGQHEAIDVIADAVLRSIDAPSNLQNRPAGAYLLLGLSNAGKQELAGGLSELLVTTEGETPVIQVDLSKQLDSQSLQFSAPKSHEKWSLSILEAVKRWPYSVLLFDKVEKADASVFSTLLRVLDTGMLSCSDEFMIDFRNTTIVLISDLGNKDIISNLFGCSYQGSGNDEGTQQEDNHFRFELLNRVDEVIFFNPASHNQRDIARLPMTDEQNKGLPMAAFFHLFQTSHDPRLYKLGKLGKFNAFDVVVSKISMSLRGVDKRSGTSNGLIPFLQGTV